MNHIHGWTNNNLLVLVGVLSLLTLPTHVINAASRNENNVDINNTHRNSEYASRRKLNDMLQNQKTRVRRQLQTALQLQLATALQQNPGLAQQLQQNPQLLANLRKKLADVYSQHHLQQQQQQQVRGQRKAKLENLNVQQNRFQTSPSQAFFGLQSSQINNPLITPTSTRSLQVLSQSLFSAL